MSAEPVSQELAAQVAHAWFAPVGDAGQAARAGTPVVSTLILDDDLPGIHTVWDGTGFVLVAGDQQADPVLGWAREGSFPMDSDREMPPGLQQLVSAWGQQILLARQAPPERATSQNAYRAKWAALLDDSGRAATEVVKEIAPLLSARWGQGAGWNACCPQDPAGPTGHAYAGCVATAMGQVLFHHQHPWRGQFVQSYEHEVYGSIDLDLLEEMPEWKAMLAQGATTAAARLLYMAGVAVRMNYGPRTSTASSSNIVMALRAYLRFSDTVRMLWRTSTPPADWESLIESELRAGRPIIHRGQGAQGGHAFNLDGWRSDGFKHLNFGWNGSYNGWYTLDAITPGAMNFTSTQGMVVGITPRREDLLHPLDGTHGITPDVLTLRWRPRDSMARVELDVALNAQFSPVIRRVVLTGGLSKHTLTRLAPNTRHFWRLAFVDKTGRSTPIPACSFVTGPSLTTGPGMKPGPMVKPSTPEVLA